MFRRSRRFSVWLLLIAWLPGLAAPQQVAAPAEVVKRGVEGVISLLQDSSLDPALRRSKIRSLVEDHFDFTAMSRSILSRGWKQASPQQQQRFIELFKQLLENTYITAIESYSSERITVGEGKVKQNKAKVPVSITLKTGAEAPLLFRLRNGGQGWSVYDVSIEGVSLVSNYRSTFGNILRREGMDGLLSRLEQKVAAAGDSAT